MLSSLTYISSNAMPLCNTINTGCPRINPALNPVFVVEDCMESIRAPEVVDGLERVDLCILKFVLNARRIIIICWSLVVSRILSTKKIYRFARGV
jgi:hypothetical protein